MDRDYIVALTKKDVKNVFSMYDSILCVWKNES